MDQAFATENGSPVRAGWVFDTIIRLVDGNRSRCRECWGRRCLPTSINPKTRRFRAKSAPNGPTVVPTAHIIATSSIYIYTYNIRINTYLYITEFHIMIGTGCRLLQ